LVINEENEFNKIYNSLLEIELLVDKSSIFIKKIHHSRSNKNQEYLKNLSFDLETISYQKAVDSILHMLLGMISAEIHSKNDSQILYDRIINVFNKLDSQVESHTLKDILDIPDNVFKELKSSSLIENRDIIVSFTNDLRQFTNNFKNRFFSEAGTKGVRKRLLPKNMKKSD
jgi:ribosome-associated translation inhibitor RaiA